MSDALQNLVTQIDALMYEQRAELKAYRIVLQCTLERLGRMDASGKAALDAIRTDSLGAAGRLLPAQGESQADSDKMRAAVLASLGLLFGEIAQALTPPSRHGSN